MPGKSVITRRGEGPDLVLVHGWAMHSRIWGEFADRLALDFTLHLVDLPGHGEAIGQGSWGLEELMGQLLGEVPPAVWLGWSLGGLVALQGAMANPARVRGLVLIGTNPRFLADKDWPDAMPAEVFDAFQTEFDADARAAIDHFLGLMVAGTSHAARTLAELRERVFAYPLADPEALRDGLAILRRSDLVQALPGIEQRALWIAGDEDGPVRAVCSECAAGLMPRGAFKLIEDAGHAPFLSHPHDVQAAVLEFLGGGRAT
jgi:pimeloyl-[acyl-carrier protein] methyl ester esterase